MSEDIPESIRQRISAVKQCLRDNRQAIQRAIGTVVLAIVAVATLRISWIYNGPLATIVYTLMFIVGFAMVPSCVLVLRGMVPNFVGRLLFALGQLGYGGSWLVETPDGWELCPRRRIDDQEQYYFDGRWHDIADDSNMTRLGWAKWGICWHKTSEDLGRYRVDDQATDDYAKIEPKPDTPDVEDIATMSPQEAIEAGQNGALADGGTSNMTADPPEQLLEKPGVWVVDYRKYWRDRVQEIGETGLLDDVERVAQREEALANTVSQNRLMIGSAFGLLLGAATGYVAMAGF